MRRLFSSKKRIVFVLIVIAFVLAGIWYNQTTGKAETKSAKIEKGTVREELVLSGEIKAEEMANLAFLSSGQLDYVGVTEGQSVKKGDVLAKLDPTNAYQTYLQAEADLRRYEASLQKTYDDVQGHSKDESYAQIESRTISETNKDKAYRALVIARKNLSNLTLRSPFDGIVSNIAHPFSGLNTSLTESQIQVVNPDSVYFSVSADQTEVTKLKVGQKVLIVLDSYPDKEFEGELVYIGFTPKIGESGAIYEVKVRLKTSDYFGEARIGMTGDAKFILSEKYDVYYLPTQFVNTDANGKYVHFAKKNNKRYVNVGIEGEDRVEISGEGITQGVTIYD